MDVIDAHAHLEPRMLEPGRMIEKLDHAGVRRVVLIPSMNDPLPDTPERLLWLARQLSQRATTRPLVECIHRSTLTADGNLRLGGKTIPIYRKPDNDAVASLVRAHPDRFWGWIFLNPKNADALDDLEKYRDVPGMVGIKLHPHWHDWPIASVLPIVRRARELSMPLLIHFGFGDRGDVRALCDAAGDTPVVAAHAGFPFYRDLWRLADAYPRLHVDLSSPYIDEALARRAVEAMGPGRCVYGTDAPYGFHDTDGSYDYGEIQRWILRMPISNHDLEGILSRTFLEIVGRDA